MKRRKIRDPRPWAVIDRHGRVIARYHVDENAEQHAAAFNESESSPFVHARYEVRYDPTGRKRLEP